LSQLVEWSGDHQLTLQNVEKLFQIESRHRRQEQFAQSKISEAMVSDHLLVASRLVLGKSLTQNDINWMK